MPCRTRCKRSEINDHLIHSQVFIVIIPNDIKALYYQYYQLGV